MISLHGGKRFVNSFKRRGFLAHIVESPLPTSIPRGGRILKPAMPDKYWFKFRHPLSQLLWIERAQAQSLLPLLPFYYLRVRDLSS